MINWWPFRKKHPWPWYAKLKAPIGKLLLEEVEFVVLDMEMSGLDARLDRILSIAAVKVKGDHIALSEMFYEEVSQPETRPEAAAVHELLPFTGKKESEVLEALARFCGAQPVIGHFVRLDREFLHEGYKRLGVRWKNAFYDTSALLPRADDYYREEAFPPKDAWKLENICKRYKLPNDEMHHASGDALATALLFVHLRKTLQKRGLQQLRDL